MRIGRPHEILKNSPFFSFMHLVTNMSRKNAKVAFLVASLAIIPFILGISMVFGSARLRIADPMIGAAQFIQPAGAFEITVENPYQLFLSSWQVRLNHVDFPGQSYGMEINTIAGPALGKYVLGVKSAADILFGLYDLKITCEGWGRSYTIQEPHAVCVYNASMSELQFGQVADPHISFPDEILTLNLAPPHMPNDRGEISVNNNLRRLINETNIARPQFLLFTGDLATRGQEQEFQELRRIFQSSQVPILATSGNHDYRSPPAYNQYIGPHYYARTIASWRIVILDTGASEGNGLFGEQMRWYEQQLQEAQSLQQQVFVGMHSPSQPDPGGGYVIAGNTEFRSLNRLYGVRVVLTGHHHTFEAFYDNGTLINANDPLMPSVGPLYVKTNSPSIADDTTSYNYPGWRWISCNYTGALSIGYDLDNTGTPQAVYGLPRNGLNITCGVYSVRIGNAYRKAFSHVLIPVTFAVTPPLTRLVPSTGTVINQFWNETTSSIQLDLNLAALSDLNVTFTPSLP